MLCAKESFENCIFIIFISLRAFSFSGLDEENSHLFSLIFLLLLLCSFIDPITTGCGIELCSSITTWLTFLVLFRISSFCWFSFLSCIIFSGSALTSLVWLSLSLASLLIIRFLLTDGWTAWCDLFLSKIWRFLLSFVFWLKLCSEMPDIVDVVLRLNLEK